MILLKKRIREVLIGDAQLVTLLGGPKVFLSLGPVTPKDTDYPMLTLRDDDGITYKHLNIYVADLWVDIWTKGNAYQTSAGLIAQRINQILNRKGFLSAELCIYRLEKEVSPELWDKESQAYHKIIKYKVIVEGD